MPLSSYRISEPAYLARQRQNRHPPPEKPVEYFSLHLSHSIFLIIHKVSLLHNTNSNALRSRNRQRRDPIPNNNPIPIRRLKEL